MIQFIPLNESHTPLIYKWFNVPHVQEFYSLREWTLEEVQKKLQNQAQIHIYLIYQEKVPIGYIQSYSVKEHPWENQELPQDIVLNAAGLDLFIGEKQHLQKGLGSQILELFLNEHIWPQYHYCIVDPDVRNTASIRLFQKCGFKEHKKIETHDALMRKVELLLFIKERVDPYISTKV